MVPGAFAEGKGRVMLSIVYLPGVTLGCGGRWHGGLSIIGAYEALL